MKLDLHTFEQKMTDAPSEQMVSTEEVNSYLLETVIRPSLNGNVPRYGDLDYDRFNDIDLRRACGYCDELERMSDRLRSLAKSITDIAPAVRTARSYC